MPRPFASREWLDRILAREAFDPAALVAACPAEDLHLDYKSGKALRDNPDKAAAMVKEYVAAFANSAGGLLVLGYDHKARLFDGLKPVGNTSPHDWVVRALAPVASYLLPPPEVERGLVRTADLELEVIVVATRRSARLVPVQREGEPVYMVRVGDSTLEWKAVGAPHYLATDLLTGRRSSPLLNVNEVAIGIGDEYLGDRLPGTQYVEVMVSVEVENTSLTIAEDVRIGLVTWREGRTGVRNQNDRRLLPSPSLQAMIDVRQPEQPGDYERMRPAWELGHVPAARRTTSPVGPVLEIGAFEVVRERLERFVTPIFPALPPGGRAQRTGETLVRAALYVMARNCEPYWHQLDYSLDHRAVGSRVAPIVTPAYDRAVVAVGFLPPVEFLPPA